ncbi:MAG: basic amino acid ABC transporter substrate-binding protein [Oscillospiraceae bacterium]|nr:basic amino acid ABC transporter substrate-binding protein [Oscillospiraceae bacterium]
MKKISLVLLAFILAAAMLTSCFSDKADELVMATNAEFPPFEFKNDNNEFDGFDVELAKALADEMGMKLRIDDMNFDSIITAVSTGMADVGIAAMTDRADRRESVDFTMPYFETTLVIIVPEDSDITSPEDLEDKRIAVQEGTTSDIFCEDELPDATISRFKKAPDTVLELNNGRVDAIVIDRSVAEQFIGDNPNLKILDDQLAEEVYAIAVQKGNTELLAKLNAAIQTLKNNGEYQRIFDLFFES